MALASEIHARLREQAVDIGRGDLKPLTEVAAAHGVTVVCGMHELDSDFSGTTLFNTVVVIGPDGANVWQYKGVNTIRAGRMDELALHPTVKRCK